MHDVREKFNSKTSKSIEKEGRVRQQAFVHVRDLGNVG